MASLAITTSSLPTQSPGSDCLSRSCYASSSSSFQSFVQLKNTMSSSTAVNSKKKKMQQKTKRFSMSSVKATSSKTDLSAAAADEPISLGTVKIADDVNLGKLEGFLYQWGSSLTQNANIPLPLPLKVDKIDGGVRLGYIRLADGVIEDLCHIDCVIFPASPGSSAIFRALRSGRFKDRAAPGEQIIMQSLLQALKKSIQLSRV